MPVHRDREKKKITAEEMEVEEQEQDATSSEEEDSDTSSVSEDGDSSGGNLWNFPEHKHNVLKQMMTLAHQVWLAFKYSLNIIFLLFAQVQSWLQTHKNIFQTFSTLISILFLCYYNSLIL